MVLMAFYHMAVADRGLLDTLAERSLTAIGCEVIQQEDGHAAGAGGDQRDCRADDDADRGASAALEFGRTRDSAGRHAGRSAGARGGPGRGRGGVCGRRAHGGAAGARVMAFDRDPRKLRHLMEHAPAWRPAWRTRTRLPKPWPAPTW